MVYHSAEEWQRAEEQADARRQQAELFDEFNQTTPEQREIAAYYAHQSEVCECDHTLGMHDYPPTRDCQTTGCKCQEFTPKKQYDRFRMTPAGEIKTVGEEAA